MSLPKMDHAQRMGNKAARAGDLDRLKELLDGPDLIKDKSDKLIIALREETLDRDDHDRISLDYLFLGAIRGGQPAVLRYLRDRYPYPGAFFYWFSILNAVESGSIETVQLLFEFDKYARDSLNFYWPERGNPIIHAIWLDHRQDALRMTEFLLQQGADPNHEDETMKQAICSSWPELVELLEKYGGKQYTTEEQIQLFSQAVRGGNIEAVIRLVEKGADVNELSGDPHYAIQPPLHHAIAHCDHVEIVRYLLRAGADPNWTKGNIGTPLKEARKWALRHPQWNPIVELLLEYGAQDG